MSKLPEETFRLQVPMKAPRQRASSEAMEESVQPRMKLAITLMQREVANEFKRERGRSCFRQKNRYE